MQYFWSLGVFSLLQTNPHNTHMTLQEVFLHSLDLAIFWLTSSFLHSQQFHLFWAKLVDIQVFQHVLLLHYLWILWVNSGFIQSDGVAGVMFTELGSCKEVAAKVCFSCGNDTWVWARIGQQDSCRVVSKVSVFNSIHKQVHETLTIVACHIVESCICKVVMLSLQVHQEPRYWYYS